ncbi:LytTR family DNA-binding domain-containing protein [Lacrimispora sp. BS-2]|uniref:Stage 0 sporulation protein A homolog n=1 Tax=Lacrimispora sp. BS-2 TaxID=3151850 RepID=A0AAU7PN80_9FIRM
MKILMCDDQVEFLTILKSSLNKILSEMNIEIYMVSFTDPDKVLDYIKEYMDVDIVFMDILMGEKNGFEVAKQISLITPKCKIIFLSSTSAYALKGYDIKAAYYLMKPIKKTKLSLVLNDVITDLRYNDDKYIVERNDLGIHKIFLDEIIYIETCNRNTMIHTTSGNYISYKTMKEHETRLNKNFNRCHSSYIVNMEFIKHYQVYELYLLNDDTIFVSKNRRKDFLHALTKFYGKQLK